MSNNAKIIINKLNNLYPNARCQLHHHSNFQFLIAVVLSAQTTDEKVNSVTSILFNKYPNSFDLSKAKVSDIEKIIKPLGLYHNKAKNIINLSKILVKNYNGKVINDRKILESLPGVGRKTCNVVLNNCFNVSTFAVDIHVSRISKRLGIADEKDDVNMIEKKLMNYFPSKYWGKLHHQFIIFGRSFCKSKKPECARCAFKNICNYFE